jgi:hypothetical protein
MRRGTTVKPLCIIAAAMTFVVASYGAMGTAGRASLRWRDIRLFEAQRGRGCVILQY